MHIYILAHLCVWWLPGVPGKQALQGEIVVPVYGREIPCTYGWPLPCLLNYCFAGPWVAAVAPPHSSLFFSFGLSLMRIPLVRWSLGFMPELVFGLGFGLGGGSSRGGPLFWPMGRHTLLRLQRIQGGCAGYMGTWWTPQQKEQIYQLISVR